MIEDLFPNLPHDLEGPSAAFKPYCYKAEKAFGYLRKNPTKHHETQHDGEDDTYGFYEVPVWFDDDTRIKMLVWVLEGVKK